MNLHQLAVFLSVAQEGSVTRGADRIAISQPAVSRAIAELEGSLGVRLFDRGPKGVTVTEAGRTLQGYATRIFSLEREASEAMADLRGLRAGRLAIGASTTIGDRLLPPAIAAFGTAHPEVELSMDVANTETIHAGVEAGRYDVGYTEGDADPERFEIRTFYEDELLLVAAPSHPLAGGEASLDELSDCSFVMREAGSGTRIVVERELRAHGIVPRVTASLGSSAAVQSAVAAGLGLAALSRLAVADDLASGRLATIEVPFKIRRSLHRVRLAWRGESAALRAFERTFREIVEA